MSDTLFSHATFRWILTVLTLSACLWALTDVVRLVRLRGADGSDPLVRDKRFGYVVGIVLGLFGVTGVLRYHGVF